MALREFIYDPKKKEAFKKFTSDNITPKIPVFEEKTEEPIIIKKQNKVKGDKK